MMRFNHRSLSCLLLLVSLTLATSGQSNLVGNSPFLPPGFGATREPPPPTRQPVEQVAGLEFRGVYELNGDTFVNIYNRNEKRGRWVRVNDSSAEYQVTDFDPIESAVELMANGRSVRLALPEAKHASLPVSTSGAPKQTTTARSNPVPTVSRAATPRPPTLNSPNVVRRRVVRPTTQNDNNRDGTTNQQRNPVRPGTPVRPSSPNRSGNNSAPRSPR